jgi:hypothetical protein
VPTRYLVLERSWIEGVHYRVKPYEIDLRSATNVLNRGSLSSGRPYQAVEKRLVVPRLRRTRAPRLAVTTCLVPPRAGGTRCSVTRGDLVRFDHGRAEVPGRRRALVENGFHQQGLDILGHLR